MVQKVFEKIEELNNEFVDMWEDVCKIESPSNYKAGVDEVGEYFINFAKNNSWDIEVFEQEKFGNAVCVVMNPTSTNGLVTVSGHMDTVHPVGLFKPPVTYRDGDKLHGPGAVDCKGGIVAGFLAMKALADCGYKDRPVMMLLQSNEEVGSGINNKATINYMCEKAKNSVAFLNMEGHEGRSDGTTCLKRKGIAGCIFKINGIESHASYCAKEGASAIAEAAHKILELEKVKDHNGLTFSCGLINGGTASNTVPGSCEFKVDIRFATSEQYDRAMEIVNKVADTVYVPGCTCEVVHTNMRVPMELNDRNIRLLNKANEIFKSCGMPALEIGERTGGSDASDISACGIPTLDSIGPTGENAHSIDEYGLISTLAESAKRVASIILGL